MTPPLLEVRDLVVRFPLARGITEALRRRPRRTVRAVDGVSFSVQRGQMLALVGESGSGKTTTAHTALRLREPDSGTVRFEGEDGPAALRALRRRAQVVYQDPYESLDPRFRVRATVAEPLEAHRTAARPERDRRVRDALERAGLTPVEQFLDRHPHELSGGQRQRVAIAAALILEPRLLVVDEPVSMLDVSVRAGILGLLDGLRRDGLGILMITHDLSTAAHYADRIAVMYLGRIVEEGPAKRLVREPRHPYTQALVAAVPKRDPRERSVPLPPRGEPPSPVNPPAGCRFHPRCPAAMARCARDDPRVLIPVGDGHGAACWLLE